MIKISQYVSTINRIVFVKQEKVNRKTEEERQSKLRERQSKLIKGRVSKLKTEEVNRKICINF